MYSLFICKFCRIEKILQSIRKRLDDSFQICTFDELFADYDNDRQMYQNLN